MIMLTNTTIDFDLTLIDRNIKYPEKLHVWADMLNIILINSFFIDSNLIAIKI